jgi:two-component system sensor histidine kinase UhpB
MKINNLQTVSMLTETKLYRLLVIEDNPGDYVLLKQHLKRSHLDIEEIIYSENMAAVPAVLKGNRFDIVLLDLTLPDSTGVDSVIALDRLLPHTPIIVLSGLSTLETAIQSIALGAQDYLVKGDFDEKLLAKSIQYSIERKKTIEILRESKERYEYVNRATNDTIWEWNYAANEGRWGDGIIKIFGYSEEELQYNHNWTEKYVHPHDKERVKKRIAKCKESGIQNWQDAYRFRCANGTYKEVFDRGFILFDENMKPYRMIGAMTDVTEKKKLEKELTQQQLKQQKLITEVTIQAQEKERNELGKELHDNINQILATVKMYIGTIISGKNIREDILIKSYEYLSDAMEEIRKLSHSLVTPSLGDIGLEEALEELVGDTNLMNGLRVNLSVDDKYYEKEIDKNKELVFYRIVQEQLNNITKHAEAEEVFIKVNADDEKLFLSVADNGVGFDPADKNAGIGLKNINSRVDFYSGTMNIISAPGQGCILEVYIPH